MPIGRVELIRELKAGKAVCVNYNIYDGSVAGYFLERKPDQPDVDGRTIAGLFKAGKIKQTGDFIEWVEPTPTQEE